MSLADEDNLDFEESEGEIVYDDDEDGFSTDDIDDHLDEYPDQELDEDLKLGLKFHSQTSNQNEIRTKRPEEQLLHRHKTVTIRPTQRFSKHVDPMPNQEDFEEQLSDVTSQDTIEIIMPKISRNFEKEKERVNTAVFMDNYSETGNVDSPDLSESSLSDNEIDALDLSLLNSINERRKVVMTPLDVQTSKNFSANSSCKETPYVTSASYIAKRFRLGAPPIPDKEVSLLISTSSRNTNTVQLSPDQVPSILSKLHSLNKGDKIWLASELVRLQHHGKALNILDSVQNIEQSLLVGWYSTKAFAHTGLHQHSKAVDAFKNAASYLRKDRADCEINRLRLLVNAGICLRSDEWKETIELLTPFVIDKHITSTGSRLTSDYNILVCIAYYLLGVAYIAATFESDIEVVKAQIALDLLSLAAVHAQTAESQLSNGRDANPLAITVAAIKLQMGFALFIQAGSRERLGIIRAQTELSDGLAKLDGWSRIGSDAVVVAVLNLKAKLYIQLIHVFASLDEIAICRRLFKSLNDLIVILQDQQKQSCPNSCDTIITTLSEFGKIKNTSI